jgi:hypothetical protein
VCEFLYLQVFVFITPRVKAFNSEAVFVFGLMGFVGLLSSWVFEVNNFKNPTSARMGF